LMGEEGDLPMKLVRFMHFGSANVASIETPLFCGSYWPSNCRSYQNPSR
jgi:hypothetical protein